jgi:hypothetical protein
MNTRSSSAARIGPAADISWTRTVVAIVVVTLVFLLISKSMLWPIWAIPGALVIEGPFRLIQALFLAFLPKLGPATAFVLVYALSKPVFVNHWVLYGALWSFNHCAAWLAQLIRRPGLWDNAAISIAFSVAACLIAAYLTRTILRK